jgi:hypothetical protein
VPCPARPPSLVAAQPRLRLWRARQLPISARGKGRTTFACALSWHHSGGGQLIELRYAPLDKASRSCGIRPGTLLASEMWGFSRQMFGRGRAVDLAGRSRAGRIQPVASPSLCSYTQGVGSGRPRAQSKVDTLAGLGVIRRGCVSGCTASLAGLSLDLAGRLLYSRYRAGWGCSECSLYCAASTLPFIPSRLPVRPP